MPARLRPKAPVAADAILVGDPGRSLLLAQELLEAPRMSNHARGLWGYSGRTPAGHELTIQATGMGGPSATAVLADLAELGLRRAIRVGTCTALGGGVELGELLIVREAIAAGGSASSFGLAEGERVWPDERLHDGLVRELGEGAREATTASLDSLHGTSVEGAAGQTMDAVAADMQTAAVLGRGRGLGIAVAAVLVVADAGAGEALDDEALEVAAKRAGQAAAAAFGEII
ncbi:MAG TPA: hypothetical protein VHQ43_07845 [Solirubrobacterales bacterium]|jgi:uridine phosphorylase|nr:hypothetical protein [Solirubrobacterales bacterium]